MQEVPREVLVKHDETKPLLVGEANPYSRNPDHALLPWPERASGRWLMDILGLSEREYLRRFERVNLCVGRQWSWGEAKQRAATIRAAWKPPIILLGKKVAEAFGVGDQPAFTRVGSLYLVPHPSGLNRVWNDPESITRARAFLAQFLA